MKYQRADGTFATYSHSFYEADINRLASFLDSATEVVPLRDKPTGGGTVALRHDVDHNLEHALQFARWEADHGWRSTYYVLPTAWYWNEPGLEEQLCEFEALGHEVGLHSNVVAEVASTIHPRSRWESPAYKLSRATIGAVAAQLEDWLGELRGYGLTITGIAAHGDIRCYEMGVSNDLRYTRLDISQFGLDYDADRLAATGRKLHDNHGQIHGGYRLDDDVPVFMSLHPCHWDIAQVASVRQRR